MGRPRGPKNKPKETNGSAPTDEPAPGIGHNELSDDDRQALFFQWLRQYKVDLEAKKTADAALKNTCKKAKAELGANVVADIKLAIEAETEEGEAAIKERMEAQARVLRWLGLPIGAQGSLFPDVDLTPAVDRAFEDGKRQCMQNEPCSPPHDPSTPQYQRHIDGYQHAQAIIVRTKLKPMPAQDGDAATDEDERDVRPRFMQEAEAERLGTEPVTHTVTE